MKSKSRKTKARNRTAMFKKAPLRNVVIVLAVLVFGSIGYYIQTSSRAATSLAAGHIPGRVLLGMAGSDSKSPQYPEAVQITGPVYERRIFTPNWITANGMNNMLNECASRGQYCVISFKVPNNDWLGVTQAKYNEGLDIAMNVARSRAQPFAFAVHHEPGGDGIAEQWAAMQEYLVTYLSPVNDKMAFTTIANGFHWGPNQGSTEAVRSSYYPDSLIAKMNQYRGIMGADFYDAEPQADGNYRTNADRTSMKIQGFTNWAKTKGIKALGVGEFGATTADELTKSWKVMFNNKDMFVYANYFNSLSNSRFDWRLIPDTYPVTDPGNPLDLGGTPVSEARLNAFKAALAESAVTSSPANAAPAVPANLIANPTSVAVSLSWSASSDPDGTVVGYQVRYKTTSSTTWGTPVDVTGTLHTVSSLTSGTSYDFQVRAKDNDGAFSAYTATKSAAPIAPNQNPTVPRDVSAQPKSNSAIVSWSPSSDPDGSVVSYQVRHRLSGSTTWLATVDVTGTEKWVFGLDNKKKFDFQVRAKDNDGLLSSWSAIVSATPSAKYRSR